MADNSLGNKTGNPVVLPNSRPWTAFTPVLSGTGSMVFTCTGFYRDNLDSREVIFQATGNNVASGAGATVITLSLPPSSTITTSKLPSATPFLNVVGVGQTYGVESTGLFDEATTVVAYNSTSVAFVRPTSNTYYATSNFNTATQMFIAGRFTIPIDELAGGYTAYGAGLKTGAKSGLESPGTPQTALTVTCPQAGFSVTRAVGIAYSDSAGVWRLRLNINVAFTSATITALTLTIAGVTFQSTGSQALHGIVSAVGVASRFYTNGSTATIGCDLPATVLTGVVFSGDVELASKPTWA